MPDLDMQSLTDKMHQDGGYTSRKLWLTIFAMLLIAGIGALSGLAGFAALAPNVTVVVGGIVGALGVFAGANVGTKLVASGIAKEAVKAAGKLDNKPDPTPQVIEQGADGSSPGVENG